MRLYSVFIGGLVLCVIGVIFLVGGDPLARWIHVAGCLGTIGGTVFSLRVTTPLERYRLEHALPFTMTAVAGQISGYHFWGEFSIVVLMLPVGGFIFGLCARLAPVIIGMTVTLVTYWALLIGLMTGSIEYVGLIRPTFEEPWKFALVGALVTYASVFAVVIARWAGNASRDGLRELEAVTDEASRRAALPRGGACAGR